MLDLRSLRLKLLELEFERVILLPREIDLGLKDIPACR